LSIETPSSTPSARVARDPLIGQTIADRFVVEELIGQGGMGKVYRAQHLGQGRPVVLKLLKPALLEDPTLVGRFEREAEAASRLHHPNLIAVLGFGRIAAEGTLYIAMELAPGKDLRALLRDEWPVPEARLCNIVAQVLSALSEVHARNVIHRDLKPENIMVEARPGEGDFVKVLDFGIARILDSDLPRLTRKDVVCGTPQYMAPEQATGGGLDARSDLYAVGVILYQMSTGHLPFDGQSSMEVLTRQVNEPPVPPRLRQPGAPISEAMERMILNALEKDPARRPQTAEQFRRELLAVVLPAAAWPAAGTGAALAPVAGMAATVPGSTGRWRAVVAGVAASALATAVLAGAKVARVYLRAPAPGVVAAEVADGYSPPALVARARQLADDPAAARTLLEEALRLRPEAEVAAEAHYLLAGLVRDSEPDRARREYEASRALDPRRYSEAVDRILRRR
jgi:tRNA A-37 threonylcarbamoyl transferase component Bud32